MNNARLVFALVILCACAKPVSSQKLKTEKLFQFSLVPTIGSNGLHPGTFKNYFSINLTSGYSHSNLVFELGGISNLNTDYTRGIQLAGIANVTGGNAYAGLNEKEIDLKRRSGFEANLTGWQISGVTNIVVHNVFGWQATGGVNISRNALIGFQLAGISNLVHKYSFGFQLAGLTNASNDSMDGVQISGLSNYTSGGLYGLQIGSVNRIGFSEGKNSSDNADPTGIQIGIVNIARKMNGFQVGLVNIAKRSQGFQLGLVNLYRGGTANGTKDGTSVGLINLGDLGYVGFSCSEMFAYNIEVSTGNRKNSRLTEDRFKYVNNALIYSIRPWNNPGQWAFGYGLKKMVFNRSSEPGMSEFRFIAYGIDAMHINYNKGKLTKDLNILTRLKVMIGSRLSPKLFNIYLFGALSGNVYYGQLQDNPITQFVIGTSKFKSGILKYWIGLNVGVLIH